MIKIRNLNATVMKYRCAYVVHVHIQFVAAHRTVVETIPEMHQDEQCRLMPSQEVRGRFLQLDLFTTEKLLYLPVSYSVVLL